MILLDTCHPRTLAAWLAEYTRPGHRGSRLEGWLFESAEARRAAEARLAQAGVIARLRSAYKPLLHYFLEEADLQGLRLAVVRYPVHPDAAPNRYTLEAYPLAGLLPDAPVRFEAGGAELLRAVPGQPAPQPIYLVDLHYADGRVARAQVEAPNWLAPGQRALSPTGWLRVTDAAGRPQHDAACLTEYQAVYADTMACVRAQPWKREPYFPRLAVRADIPALEFAPGFDEALVSTCEALHEDLYFSLLEHFQQLSGRPPGDRGLQPGQIVPDIRPLMPDDGQARLRVEVREVAAAPAMAPQPAQGSLDEVDAPMPPARIAGWLAGLGGEPFQAVSRQGRPVEGRYLPGPGPAVLISAAQHANETSGVVGALRAAYTLKESGDAHFALIACENPDGYALHQQYCAVHPRHMHHAARYSALGDDVAYREQAPRYEQQARIDALAMSGAQLHVNLHGYPAHEWTRPMSGYLPHLFEAWTIPRGFFLVLRYHPGWQAQARQLIEGVTARLARLPGLLEFNAMSARLYEAHTLQSGFDCINGIAVHSAESRQERAPLAILSEFPDETVYGERFRLAHTVQCTTVLAAVAQYRQQQLLQGETRST
ncbi:MAG TPA: peptidase M14 [Bordetella sp.]